MDLVKASASVLAILQEWKDELKPEEVASTPLPVIIVPEAWMRQAVKTMRLEDTDVIRHIYNCEVIVDDVEEPLIVGHDGRILCFHPEWRGIAPVVQAAEARRARRNAKRAKDAGVAPATDS